MKFSFQNSGNSREDKNGRNLFLALIMKKKILIYFAKIELFSILETRSSLSMPVFIFSTISQISKTKFHVIWTQTCRNLKSIKFANQKY